MNDNNMVAMGLSLRIFQLIQFHWMVGLSLIFTWDRESYGQSIFLSHWYYRWIGLSEPRPEETIVCFTSKFSSKNICWSIAISMWMTSLIITMSLLVEVSQTNLSMNWDKIWWIDSVTSLQSNWINLTHWWCFCYCIVLVSHWPDIDIAVVSRQLIGWLEKWNEILEHVWTWIWSHRCAKTGINNSTCFHVGLVNIFFGWLIFSHNVVND